MNYVNHDKVELTTFFINQFFFSFYFFYKLFLVYIKLSEDSLSKYYQGNKERLQKKADERYQSLSKEINTVVEKKCQKMKNKSWLI